MEIDKYLTLDLEGQALEYVQEEGIEYVDWALQMLLDANPLDEYPNILIEDCIGYIRSLVGMGERLEGKGLSVAFYTKAVKVLNDSNMAYDEQELHDDAYAFADEYLNASSANYAYMQGIIYDSLMKTFQVDKNSSKEILDVYREVTIPIYEIIKKITINDEEEFTDINKAQEYINQSLIEYAKEIYDNDLYFSIEVALMDKLEVFELVLDITDAYENIEISEASLMEILLRPHDYLGDELPIKSVEQSRKYTIELNEYIENEMKSSTKVAHTMMDEAYAQEAIKDIKSLKDSKSIDEYARYLISDTYIKENGFELSTSGWLEEIGVDDARMQCYLDKVRPLENYLDNCLEIVMYLAEHTDCDAKLVVDYLAHAQQWYVDFEKIDNHANLLDEENPNQYAIKIDRVIKKICVFDSDYEELLNEIYEEVGIVLFTKVFSYDIQIEGEESERIKHFYDLSGHLTCLEEEGKVVTGIHVGLKNEVAPYRYIDFDLKEMEDKNYGGEKFEESLIHYLNNIDTSWADDIVVDDGDMMMHHYTIEIDR
jgi:hypothetical protein